MTEKRNNNPKIVLKDEVLVKDSITVTLESYHLIGSNKKKVSEILSKQNLNEEDIIDAYISLHIVLEVGLNALFRHIVLWSSNNTQNHPVDLNNLDDISFIQKVASFIYFSKFDFTNIDKMDKYRNIIGKLKNFSFERNRLLHGHAISSTTTDDKKTRLSKIKERLVEVKLREQIKKFLFILEGMKFYFNSLESSITPAGKMDLINSYLDDSFIPKQYHT